MSLDNMALAEEITHLREENKRLREQDAETHKKVVIEVVKNGALWTVAIFMVFSILFFDSLLEKGGPILDQVAARRLVQTSEVNDFILDEVENEGYAKGFSACARASYEKYERGKAMVNTLLAQQIFDELVSSAKEKYGEYFSSVRKVGVEGKFYQVEFHRVGHNASHQFSVGLLPDGRLVIRSCGEGDCVSVIDPEKSRMPYIGHW